MQAGKWLIRLFYDGCGRLSTESASRSQSRLCGEHFFGSLRVLSITS
ncbi:hypothetical protein GTCCBUS3UF5_31490 [Geobacillus thermoleovorans CCB_US3_UF5]|uniref:Transposase n=1 Tax=Geobacillus thermoleovorans CCB_US3_UF5 TaxID=1111068 RepID=A0ABN4A1T4_GEOTH|nr:hypothetical protein GTCCBUS3UF5_31490 [Geobacillus thermoleovorans CCB_US3_UF5]